MKVLLFAPNAGVSLSTGGGCDFTIKLAEILLELGHEVEIAAFHALPRSALEAIFGPSSLWASSRFRIRSESRGELPYSLFRGLPTKTSAYVGLLWPGFDRWLERTIRAARADLLWFQDDVPRGARPFLRDSRACLYVHFPLAARTPEVIPPWPETAPIEERVADRLLDRVLARVLPDPATTAVATWANSTVTARAIEVSWPGARPTVVPTFVRVPPGPSPAPREVERLLAVGTVARGKGYHLLIPWLGAARRAGVQRRLDIVGFSRDPGYLRTVRRAIAAAGLQGAVSLELDAPRGAVDRLMEQAGAIVHPPPFEPFGLSLLEGMAHGAVPVVRRSAYSGAWVDIVEAGRWGLAFDSPEELTAALRSIGDRPESLAVRSERARTRARTFSREALAGAVDRMLTEVAK